jgi:tRNA(Arg) A34 adenosine deaminase TadA
VFIIAHGAPILPLIPADQRYRGGAPQEFSKLLAKSLNDFGLAATLPAPHDRSMTLPTPMDLALEQARAAARRGEVPVGAVLLGPGGQVIAADGNRTRERHDPTAHAEINVIRAACAALGTDRLPDHDLYVTLEPCPMCATAISAARIRRLYFGAADPKSGGVLQGPRIFAHPQCHHRPDVYDGIGADAAAALLQDFFANLRTAAKD